MLQGSSHWQWHYPWLQPEKPLAISAIMDTTGRGSVGILSYNGYYKRHRILGHYGHQSDRSCKAKKRHYLQERHLGKFQRCDNMDSEPSEVCFERTCIGATNGNLTCLQKTRRKARARKRRKVDRLETKGKRGSSGSCLILIMTGAVSQLEVESLCPLLVGINKEAAAARTSSVKVMVLPILMLGAKTWLTWKLLKRTRVGR